MKYEKQTKIVTLIIKAMKTTRLYFPTIFMLRVSFSPAPECVEVDCWNQAFQTPPCHQDAVVVVIVIVAIVVIVALLFFSGQNTPVGRLKAQFGHLFGPKGPCGST